MFYFQPSYLQCAIKDPIFTEKFSDYPSFNFKYYLKFLKNPNKKHKFQLKTRQIINKFNKDKLYNCENSSFFEITDEYKSNFGTTTKNLLIDVPTWKAFSKNENIEVIQSEANSVLTDYYQNSQNNIVINEERESLVFDTASPNVKIAIAIDTRYLQDTLFKQKDHILMIELKYEFLAPYNSPALGSKVQLPLDLFLEYLRSDSTNFIELCLDDKKTELIGGKHKIGENLQFPDSDSEDEGQFESKTKKQKSQ